MTGLNDLFGERCVVGFMRDPALEKDERPRIILITKQLKGFAAFCRPHTLAPCHEKLSEVIAFLL